ncbi:GNAT family N-acetyltransferase [Paenibacillus physcomitrellae]|uniref:N-acetyltransferase n=1 Tax=Paenibacillus physcomitrellae TaxID=1619311 RepID=A0ABQ1FU33_9BACL|nr:GNAT family N-acetyltransferase [Paenibacillus physcomitrellae]GGA30753.1 hypothetical protein GCM10010917_14780 [Paenibacillus physcomitrellae]
MQEMVNTGYGFELQEDGKMVAEITYRQEGDVLVADHTYVSEELRGQKVAEKMLNELVDYARGQGYQIVPQCSYVQTMFRRHEKYADVWKR